MARAAEKRELRQRKREAAAVRLDEAAEVDPTLGEPEAVAEDARDEGDEEA